MEHKSAVTGHGVRTVHLCMCKYDLAVLVLTVASVIVLALVWNKLFIKIGGGGKPPKPLLHAAYAYDKTWLVNHWLLHLVSSDSHLNGLMKPVTRFGHSMHLTRPSALHGGLVNCELRNGKLTCELSL